MITTPSNTDSDLTDRLNSNSTCVLCRKIDAETPTAATDSARLGSLSAISLAQKPRRQVTTDFELVGYETICGMLAVDGKAPSPRTVMRHLRRHRDIVKPVKIGAHVGYPVEQILKFIVRLRGKSTKREMFL